MARGGGETAMEQPVKRRGWWARNWTWCVPVGVLAVLAALAGFIALVLSLVFGVMTSSDVYREALALAQEHPEVSAALGTPVEGGRLVSGSIRVSGSSGEADLSIPISGPDGRGRLLVVASRSAEGWTYSVLQAEFDQGRKRVSLLE